MNGWKRWLPGLQMVSRYEAAWLPHDLMAGLVLTTMLVPVGIAYAVASGVPGLYGLYATIVPLLAYALFGPSRILVLGPDSALAAVILAVVLPLSAGDPMRAYPELFLKYSELSQRKSISTLAQLPAAISNSPLCTSAASFSILAPGAMTGDSAARDRRGSANRVSV
jgi:MFS superfamily sulfate permease-like transporter